MPMGLMSLTTCTGLQKNSQDCWIKALPVTGPRLPRSLDSAALFLGRQEAPRFLTPSQMP